MPKARKGNYVAFLWFQWTENVLGTRGWKIPGL